MVDNRVIQTNLSMGICYKCVLKGNAVSAREELSAGLINQS